MKNLLLFRLSLLGLLLGLSTTLAVAQKAIYSEAPVVATSGYWSLETDASQPDYTTVRFYNDQHELLYAEHLRGVRLDPGKSIAAHRRLSRLLGTTLQQVQQLQSSSLLAGRLRLEARRPEPPYAAR